jgi:integrase
MDLPKGIRRRADKLQIRYTNADGVRCEETLDIRPTKSGIADALKILKQRKLAAAYGETLAERRFDEVAQEWLDRLKVKSSTRRSYRDALNLYWAGLGGRYLSTITARQLIALDDSIAWPSEKTRFNSLIPLRQLFKYAFSRGYLENNPAAGLIGKRAAGKPRPDPYTREERDQLLSWLEQHADNGFVYVYFHLAFYTGMRTGELLALTWEDFTGTALLVNKACVRYEITTTKTGEARRVVLLPETIRLLKSLPRPLRGGAIVRNGWGLPYKKGYHLNKVLAAAHEATGVRRRTGPYPWRHTYASIALSSGVRPALIAAQLGHSVQILMDVYAEYIPAEDDAAEISKMRRTNEVHDRSSIS